MAFSSIDNPYTLQFSFIPPQYISRKALTEEIVNDLKRKVPAFRGHFLTGVRGCGKTVMMAEVARIMKEQPDWVVVDIEDPQTNILISLARGLYRIPGMKAIFMEAKIDISVLGLGISVKKASAVASNETDALDLMLSVLKKSGRRLLVTIDEVTHCKEIAAFSHTLSSYARSDYDIFVLMTGLKENINEIKNDKALTFLYRAKSHTLKPLSSLAITNDYEKVFAADHETAMEMSSLTKGYSFAFQTLGYLCWEYLAAHQTEKISLPELYSDFDQYLAEFVYEKIWSELPRTEKKVAQSMAVAETDTVKDIRDALGMNSSKFSVYRDRMIEKGLIDGTEYGHVHFTLPRFEVFVKSAWIS